jgi:predicted ATP-binding protein involved in virulence
MTFQVETMGLETMQIRKISVDGLFGIFNHVIPLNMDERITIIHSPNGFGKTVMLKILDGFFNSQYSVFRNIPFNKFSIELDNGNIIEVVKISDSSKKSKESIRIEFNKINSKTKETHPLAERKTSSEDINFPTGIIEDIIPELEQVGIEEWIYLPTRETLSLGEVVEQFEHLLPPPFKKQSSSEPEWLKSIKKDINIRLIESQRLLNFVPNRPSRGYGRPSMEPTVSAYSQDIAQRIQSKLAEYGTTSQSLDRTFPARVVQQQSSSDLTDNELRDKLNELEKKRSRLIDVGLLDKDENSDFQIQQQGIDESTRNVLSVYVEDVEKKLNVFKEIARKIELLRTIVNKKFAYSYKEINFNKEKGFIFKTLYHPSSSDKDILSPTDLSSGEQHELVLLYELLFQVQPYSLVLIDEPELSLHVGWQAQFLRDLQEITKLVNLNVLMATHSPDIIQDRWDLTVELKRPEQ